MSRTMTHITTKNPQQTHARILSHFTETNMRIMHKGHSEDRVCVRAIALSSLSLCVSLPLPLPLSFSLSLSLSPSLPRNLNLNLSQIDGQTATSENIIPLLIGPDQAGFSHTYG